MGLVDGDEIEGAVEAAPLVVVFEVEVEPGEVREDDVRLFSDFSPPVLRVAVVDALVPSGLRTPASRRFRAICRP